MSERVALNDGGEDPHMSTTVYIIRNHDGHYWGRGKRWVDGREVGKVLTFSHHDEVANTVFEVSSKDIDLRCETMELSLQEGKLPALAVSNVPLPDDENGQLPLEKAASIPTSDNNPLTTT